MSRSCLTCSLALLALTGVAWGADKPAVKKPRVEVVFCLDTTGSMGGLIEGAKQKIWAVSNQIANGKPTPDLEIGLVAYRDKGDEYVTKIFDLSDDLDAVHGNLKGFVAKGGNDTPESVNQALADSVHKIKWSAEKDVLKIIFLVGDAPPHMDYADDVKYPETCKKAVEKGIIINAIQCGPDPETRKVWQDVCVKAEGEYVAIAQDGGVQVAIATPYDPRLAEINGELAKTTLTFGGARMRALDEAKKEVAAELAPAAGAERVAFNAKAGRVATYDLLDNIKNGKVKLETLKKDELPPELQKLSLKEQKEHLDKLDKRRTELNKEVLELDKKRADFIAKKQEEMKKEQKDKGGFDKQVLEMLRKQAKKYNVEY